MRTRRFLIATLLVVSWFVISAHIVVTVDTGSSLVYARWDSSKLVHVGLWDQLTPSLPQIAAGTDVERTMRAALESWLAPSELAVVLELTTERTRE